MKKLKIINLLAAFLFLFLIGGCTQANKENINDQVNLNLNPPPIEDTQEIEEENKNLLNDNNSETKKANNIYFEDFNLLPGFEILREMNDEDEVAVYKLYEYKTQ